MMKDFYPETIPCEPSHYTVIEDVPFATSIQTLGPEGKDFYVLSHWSGSCVSQIITPFEGDKGSGLAQIGIIADKVSGWINMEAQHGNMLAKDPQEIVNEIIQRDAILTYTPEYELAGYARLLPWCGGAFIEVGSLIVNPLFRHQGYGTQTVLAAVRFASGRATIFCLAENDISAKLFGSLGASKMKKSDLPDEVWELCFAPNPCSHIDSFPDLCPCVPFNLTNIGN